VEATGDWALPLTGGDDYELCFTAPAAQQALIETRLRSHCPACVIGEISAEPGLRWRDAAGLELPERGGYEHFS